MKDTEGKGYKRSILNFLDVIRQFIKSEANMKRDPRSCWLGQGGPALVYRLQLRDNRLESKLSSNNSIDRKDIRSNVSKQVAATSGDPTVELFAQDSERAFARHC